jgi:hypothetical protein
MRFSDTARNCVGFVGKPMEADEIAPLGTGGNDRGAGQLNTDQDQRHLPRGRTQALPVLHKREDVGNPEDVGERFTCGWVRACPRATTADEAALAQAGYGTVLHLRMGHEFDGIGRL